MRTSLNDIKHVEDFLSGNLSPRDALTFNLKLLLNPRLRMDVVFQKKVYALVKLHSRNELRAEIKNVEQKLFNNPEKSFFQEKINQLFLKS